MLDGCAVRLRPLVLRRSLKREVVARRDGSRGSEPRVVRVAKAECDRLKGRYASAGSAPSALVDCTLRTGAPREAGDKRVDTPTKPDERPAVVAASRRQGGGARRRDRSATGFAGAAATSHHNDGLRPAVQYGRRSAGLWTLYLRPVPRPLDPRRAISNCSIRIDVACGRQQSFTRQPESAVSADAIRPCCSGSVHAQNPFRQALRASNGTTMH